MKKTRTVLITLLALFWLGLAAWAWVRTPDASSDWERRKLAQMPKITTNNLLSGTFMSDFESYTQDQFPLRNGFRRLKSEFHYFVLRELDNNGIALAGDQAFQLEYPLDQASVSHALKCFQSLYDAYLQDSTVYFALVPDKAYYLAAGNGYPAMDYVDLTAQIADGTPWATHIDLTGLLCADDYYATDTHWRQEKILPVAQAICKAMGAEVPGEFATNAVERPFTGVYYGQAALPLAQETMYYLTSPLLQSAAVTHADGSVTKVYDEAKLGSRDLYDFFLSGSEPLLTIENPDADTEKELVLFRDSFGSSLAPLLLQGYRKVTLVDTRYVDPKLLSNYVNFQNADVLFLYSTLVLNSSGALRG